MLRLFLALLAATPAAAAAPEPIIDMHLHASAPDDYGPPGQGMCTPVTMPVWDQRGDYGAQFLDMYLHPGCADPVWAPKTEAGILAETISQMEKLNITGVLSGPPEMVARWKAAAPGRFLSGLNFNLSRGYPVERVEALAKAGRLDVLAEISTEYAGIAPTDPRLEPYWALAERLDLPVGIHVGPAPPGSAYSTSPEYRTRLNSALTMEEVLVRHPRVRVYLMHAGYPGLDDLLSLLYAHPQVYVDTGAIIFTAPVAEFRRYLHAIVTAGFGKRIMFGSDQMVWPGVIERSVAVIRDDPDLTAEQKRDILYDNAARFLRIGATKGVGK